MPFAALATVKNRIQLGRPLPFNVRNADRTLLLAAGHKLDSAEQLEALFERGALVDLADLVSTQDLIRRAPRAQLPALWREHSAQMGQVMRQADHPSFCAALDEAAAPMVQIIERDPELAIFQVLREGASADTEYGLKRSLHCAVTSLLVAQRLAWAPEDAARAFKVALTMNLSMLDLQGQLARQRTPPTDEQRADLRTHPMRSVIMLEMAGVTDSDWLHAVLHHHELEDGSGYPSGSTNVGDLASLARRADLYTAKLASRSSRDALSADLAGRQMFMQDPGHPMTAALVREFGIYPPGCHVRLASGEVGIVVSRGPTITTPIVACLTNARGAPLPAPQRVDTADRKRAVEAVVGEKSVNVKPSLETLLALI
jgi:HD-GYP domain-containing protein (c-di-GMP phosphodiesterase class II)